MMRFYIQLNTSINIAEELAKRHEEKQQSWSSMPTKCHKKNTISF